MNVKMGRNLKSFVANIAYSPIGNYLISLVGGARLYAELKVYVTKKKLFKAAKKELMNP